MRADDNKLEHLLTEARSAPPFISVNAAKRFVASHSGTGILATQSRKKANIRRIIISGGVMTAITAIVLIVGLYAPQQQLPSSSPPNRSTESVSTNARADDSAKSVSKTKTEVGTPKHSDVTKDATRDKFDAARDEYDAARDEYDAALGAYHSSDKLNETDRRVRNDGYDSVLASRRTELFASWTKERIEACELYDLDSLELSKIGILVQEDSTISQKYGALTLGIKEYEQGKVSVFVRFESKKLADDNATSPGQTGTTGDEEPVRINVTDNSLAAVKVSPVLTTDSRGRTFTHATSTGNEGTIAPIGSGDYSGEEFIAIRVRFKHAAAAPGSEDYYCLFWYEPTKTFLSLMPSRVRQAIESRNGRDSRIAQHEGALPKVLEASSVYPNPVTRDIATLDYTLREKRRVAVSVYDITGERVRNVSVSEQREPGVWRESLSLSGIPDGYYFLAVTTDNGEQNIHPVVLKR
jgi:hypothetical protein